MKKFTVISLFPEYFKSPIQESLLGRGIKDQKIGIELVNLRDFADGKHKIVDDTPFGGGPGMLLKVEPLYKAILAYTTEKTRVIFMSPQGQKLTPAVAEENAIVEHTIIICGHYEGVDQRIIDMLVNMEISIGDYVISSGMPAALVFMDAVSRYVPGFVGNTESVRQDSFQEDAECLFDPPQYTRPREFMGRAVPEILLSGDHKKIKEWQITAAQSKLDKVRPDLRPMRCVKDIK